MVIQCTYYLVNILKYITLQNQAAVMVGGVNYYVVGQNEAQVTMA